MPNDHYVSKVHLRNFLSKDKKLFTLCKNTLRKSKCSTRSICSIQDGSTNPFFAVQRAVEYFLEPIENNYNHAVEKLLNQKIDNDAINVIAGWVTHVYLCSPTAIRLGQSMISTSMDETRIGAEVRYGQMPIWTTSENLSEKVTVKMAYVDETPKYAQALGIANLEITSYLIRNLKWEVLRNPLPTSPFFTSDNPVVIEPKKNSRIPSLIAPLTPQLALRIHLVNKNNQVVHHNFDQNKTTFKTLTPKDVERINRLIVQSAENNVFFGDEFSWTEAFVKRHSKYHIEIKSTIDRQTGCTVITSEKVFRERTIDGQPTFMTVNA